MINHMANDVSEGIVGNVVFYSMQIFNVNECVSFCVQTDCMFVKLVHIEERSSGEELLMF